MAIRAILFDAFGTVIHADPAWESHRAGCLGAVHSTWMGPDVPLSTWMPAYERARAEQHALVEQDLREFDFAGRFARTMTLCDQDEHEAARWGPVAAEAYHRYQEGLIRAYDDPEPVLAALQRAGYRIGLVSNYAHAGVLHESLERLGIRHHFDALVVSGDVGYVKPHARIFEAACAALDVAPREAVMVGNDVPCDITGAKRAGLRTIWTPYPRARPAPAHPDADAVVASLAEIPGLLAKL